MSANNNKILVLAEDQNRCRDLTTILDFLGEQVWEVDHAALDKMTELNDVAAVILNGSDPDVGPALEKLVALDQGIPVLMIGDPDLSDLDAGISGHVIARMDWPLNYTKFVDTALRFSAISLLDHRNVASSGLCSCSEAWWAPVEVCSRCGS